MAEKKLSAKSILKVKNLNVILDGEEILKNISFEIKPGEALAVIGPNGAGKSVLFRALLGLLPFEGKIEWRPELKIGYVPQKFFLEKDIPLTVEEFFLLKSPSFWRKNNLFANHLIDELITFGLKPEILKKPISELSGGQFQRIIIVWAMLNHPDILLFDEPTANIDIGFEENVYQLLHKMQTERQTTILLISHDLHIIYRYAQQVLCLNRQIICQGPTEETLTAEELKKIYGESAFHHH
mgnify:CR=1 FL=1